MTRREWLACTAAAGLLHAAPTAPTAPVSIAKCSSYDGDLAATLTTMFDQLGGLGRIVRNKTVTIKLNLTGSPGLRFQGKPLGVTHYTHPKLVFAMARVLSTAGAKRIRFVESAWATGGPLEEYLLDSGWNVRLLFSAAKTVEFENTNALGNGKRYVRLKVPGGGQIFPAFDLNHAYEDTDVFMSMANCFGITPASIYGDDAGVDEPNETPSKGRGSVCHFGKRGPAKSALQEL